MNDHIGKCRCGGVSIRTSGNVHFSGYCHCDDCRRSNGAPIVAFVGFKKNEFEWNSDETLAEWRNETYSRFFCKACGSPIAYADDKLPEVTFFYTGFMENPESFPPEHHSYHGAKLGWLNLADDLPTHAITSYPRPE